jgi:hypothetical protein
MQQAAFSCIRLRLPGSVRVVAGRGPLSVLGTGVDYTGSFYTAVKRLKALDNQREIPIVDQFGLQLT